MLYANLGDDGYGPYTDPSSYGQCQPGFTVNAQGGCDYAGNTGGGTDWTALLHEAERLGTTVADIYQRTGGGGTSPTSTGYRLPPATTMAPPAKTNYTPYVVAGAGVLGVLLLVTVMRR